MSFASGPVSFQRFYLPGKLPGELSDKMLEALQGRAFGRSAPLNDDTQMGWIGPRHVLDTELTAERTAFGSFVHLALRVDRLRVPSSVLKAYVALEEQATLDSSGREHLGKFERRKAREAALARAEKEAKAGEFRRTASYPVLFDLSSHTAYLGSTGAGLGDRFLKLFSDTFGRTPEPATPECVARRLMAGTKNPAAIDRLTALRLVRPPQGAMDEDGGFSSADLSFLGKEMLSWLWHQIDADEARLSLRGGDDVTLMIDRSLRLKCDFGVSGVTAITADGPTSLPEARAALRIGKQPVKAGLTLGGRGGELRLTLDGLRFTVSGLTLPEDENEKDWRARLEQRFERIAESAALLDALFELFLLRRTAGTWSGEQRVLAAWAGGQPGERRMQVAGA